MATTIVMPKLGQSVESCIIVAWKKQIGDAVAINDPLCDVETDKTTMEVPSPVTGIVLAHLFKAGDEVMVLAPIAIVGAIGEKILADGLSSVHRSDPDKKAQVAGFANAGTAGLAEVSAAVRSSPNAVSPRARRLADQRQVDISALVGSGPAGRIIERDVPVDRTSVSRPSAPPGSHKLTPVARAMVTHGDYLIADKGTGPGGRITSKDLRPPSVHDAKDETTITELKGVRKIIAGRMLTSLQTTAQLTLTMAADARELRATREWLKQSPASLRMNAVTINDLIMFAVAQTLPKFPYMNALFNGNVVTEYRQVHLAFAVDTPRGLMVPVIRAANQLSLNQLSIESARLVAACIASTVSPDELLGGTFTVSNLGSLGIETFTPVLNLPQVAILGVGGISLKAVETTAGVEHRPHIGLSLTINHQVVDGAPAARFFQALSREIAHISPYPPSSG